MKQELREKITALIGSADLRDYFQQHAVDVPDTVYLETLGAASIRLRRKKGILAQIAADSETDAETRGDAKQTEELLAAALTGLFQPAEHDFFVVERYRMDDLDGKHIEMRAAEDDIAFLRDFEAVKAHMIRRLRWHYEDGCDFFEMCHPDKKRAAHPEVDWKAKKRACIGQPDWYWRVKLVRMAPGEREGFAEYEFICSPKGEPQYLGTHCRRDFSILSVGLEGYLPPTPYQNGDILCIDCRPYGPGASYCLVFDATEPGLKCLYPLSSGNIGFGTISDCYYHENFSECRSFLPPLFQAERCVGEKLPESCLFLHMIARKIKENPKLAKNLSNLLHGPHDTWENWPSMERGRKEEECRIGRKALFAAIGISEEETTECARHSASP